MTTLSDEARAYLAGKRSGPPLPPAADLPAWRALVAHVDAAAEADALPHLAGYPVSRQPWKGMTVCRPLEPLAAAADKAVLFLHGGGLVFFSGPMVEYRTAVEAMRLHLTVYGLDFRQPPDHPYPAAVDDGLDAYRTLVETVGPANLCLHGVSGGAAVAVAVLYRARGAGLPMPAGLALSYPMLDLTGSGQSHRLNVGDPALPEGGLAPAWRLYAAGASLTDPLVSPLFGDPAGFPPTRTLSGELDLLQSDAAAFHERLTRAAVASTLEVLPRAPHGGFGGNAPEDRAAHRRMLQFMLECWGL